MKKRKNVQMHQQTNENIGKIIKKGSYWGISLKLLFESLRFGLSIILARILSPKDFGIYTIGLFLIFYANSMTNTGFNNALVQRKTINDQHINAAFVIDICISIFFTLLCLSFANKISLFFNSPESTNIILALSSIFLLTSFYNTPMTILKRNLFFKELYILGFLENLINVVGGVLLALMGFGVWSLVYAKIFSIFIIIIFLIRESKWRPKIEFSFIAFREIFNFGLWEFLRAQLNYLVNYSDYLFIGRFLNPSYLGYYEKAFNISLTPINNINMQIGSVLFASISRIQNEKKQIRQLIKKTIIIFSLLTFPMLFGLYFISPYLINSLYGKKWVPMIISLKILSLSGIFKSVNHTLSTFNIAIGQNKKQTIRNFISYILLLISLPFSIHYGINGVAVSIFFYSFICMILTYHLSAFFIALYWKDLIICTTPGLIISSFMNVNLYWIGKIYFYEYTIINTIILAFLGIIIYILAFFLFDFKICKEFKSELISDIKIIYKKVKLKPSGAKL